MNRIQKLLFYEYKDFDEFIIIESPFANITANGLGIKQVQIGLTPRNLIIATDILTKNNLETYWTDSINSADPEIETLELISVIPLQFLTVTVTEDTLYTPNTKFLVMKLEYITNKKVYFEFGGHLLKSLYFEIWRDKLSELLNSKKLVPSLSIKTTTTPSASSSLSSIIMDSMLPKKFETKAQTHRNNTEKKVNFFNIFNRNNTSSDGTEYLRRNYSSYGSTS